MDPHRCRRVAALLATTLCLMAEHEGRGAAAARPLRRLHAVEETSEAAFDVAAAEAPEGVRWVGVGGGDELLNEGKWLPMPMPASLTLPAAVGLRFPSVPPFPGAAGASMPWLPAFAGPGAGMPALVPPYIGATRQEQLSLWASLFNPLQVRPRLPAAGTLGGPAVGEATGAQVVDRGNPAGGKAAEEEGETMDVPTAAAVPLAVPRWGVSFGNVGRRG